MKFHDCISYLNCNLLNCGEDFETFTIHNVVASDLMSDVLVVEEENLILLTSLASEQVIRTADIVGIRGIILVNAKKPQRNMVKMAEEHGLTLMNTEQRMFNACVKLGKLLEADLAGDNE